MTPKSGRKFYLGMGVGDKNVLRLSSTSTLFSSYTVYDSIDNLQKRKEILERKPGDIYKPETPDAHRLP